MEDLRWIPICCVGAFWDGIFLLDTYCMLVLWRLSGMEGLSWMEDLSWTPILTSSLVRWHPLLSIKCAQHVLAGI